MDSLKQKFNEQIKSLMPINGLAPQYQNEVIQRAEILTFKKKQQIFKQKDVDPWTYYLLEGELELEANGQLIKTIKGGSMDAQSALSQLQPRQMGAKSKGRSLVLRIARDVMDRLLTMDDPGPAAGAMEVSEVEVDEDDGGDWMTRMLQSELFSRIPPANIQRLFAVMESVSMKAGSVVVEQGSPGDYYYIIQSGRCEVSRKASAGGAPIKLAELGNGDSFGEEALVSDAKRNATVSMVTDGELVRLTKDDFIELIKKPSLDTVDYEAAKALVADGACWLDLRFSDEHAKDGIESSVNLPLNQLRGELKNLDSDRTYVAYCDSGARSAAGAFLLAQNGYDVRHLKGGLNLVHGAAAGAASAPPPEPEPEPEPEAQAAPAVADESEAEEAPLEPAPPPPPEKKAQAAAPAAAPEKKARAAAAAAAPEKKARAAAAAPAPEKKAPPAAAKAPPKSDNADVRAAELAEDVAKADTRMEEAMRLKAQADAEHRAAAKKLQSKNKELEEKAAKARAELERKAAEANAALEEAKRERVALERARRAAEAEAEAKRREEEQRMEQLKQENEARLNAERAKLEAEYAKQAEELAKLQALKEKAKAELEEERQAMERQASAASRELEQLEQAKHQAEAEEIERRIREQSEAAIRAERQRLEAEFARAAEQLAEAQREREMAELIKDEAARKAARTIAEQKVAQELARQEEELKLNLERQKLQAEAKRLRKTLDEAKKAKAEAQAKAKAAEAARRKKLKEQEAKVARDMIAAAHKVDPRRQPAPSSHDDELARANSLLAAAEAAHRKAEEAKQDLEDTQSWKKSELDALRKQMEAELADFMNENPAPKQDDAEEKKRAERMAMFEKRRKAEERKRAEANNSILNDVASQLEK